MAIGFTGLLLFAVTIATPADARRSVVDGHRAGGIAEPAAVDAANALPNVLGVARQFAVFHGIEAGQTGQNWTFRNSYVWGDVGVGPGVTTRFSSGSTLIGDCYQQPGQATGKGCSDLEPHASAPAHMGPEYQDITLDLTGVVRDIRRAVDLVADLPATMTMSRITGNSVVSSAACGSVNVIDVTGNVNVGRNGIVLEGCSTDYFIFRVRGQWISKGGGVTLRGGVKPSNVLWVFKGGLKETKDGGWVGTAIFDTAEGVANDAERLQCFDCALLVLNGKLRLVDAQLRWHPFTLFDYGDAQGAVGTLFSPELGAARHKWSANLNTGAPRLALGMLWDAETDGQPTSNADGDDTAAMDDEDGLPVFPTISTITRALAVDVTVVNATGQPSTVACWIDFNRNGSFGDVGERAAAQVSPAPTLQTATLVFEGFGVPVAGRTFMRCRVSSVDATVADPSSSIPALGPAPQPSVPAFELAKHVYLSNDPWTPGEVEDYALRIVTQDETLDFGDAPDTGPGVGPGNYNTLLSDRGAVHVITQEIRLGASPTDFEWGNLQGPLADADDLDNLDDEDGVPVLPLVTAQTTALQLSVVATNVSVGSAALRCYMDFNRDGDFADPGEGSDMVTVSAGSGTGSYALTFQGFSSPTPGATILRCRIAYNPSEVSKPIDTAYSGEVEDHLVVVQP